MAVGSAVLRQPQTYSPSLTYSVERFSLRMARRIAAAVAVTRCLARTAQPLSPSR